MQGLSEIKKVRRRLDKCGVGKEALKDCVEGVGRVYD